MRRFTERAVEASDVVLFLIDARAGVLPLDEAFANWLRKRAAKVILVANKCEGRAGQNGLAEAHGLGLGEPIPVSPTPQWRPLWRRWTVWRRVPLWPVRVGSFCNGRSDRALLFSRHTVRPCSSAT